MLLNINLQSKTLKILSLIFSVTGIIFILASKHVGSIAIRIAMILVISFCLINLKMTYKYLTQKEKINYLIAITASIAGLYKPEFTMLISGLFLLYVTLPMYIKAVTNKDYSNPIMIIISGIGVLFSTFCILNSKAALQTIISIIGITFTVLGCIALYYALITKKVNTYHYEDDIFKIDDNLSS